MKREGKNIKAMIQGGGGFSPSSQSQRRKMTCQILAVVVAIVATVATVVNCQTCNPDRLTAPCDSTLPCPTGQVCDNNAQSCCLLSDVVSGTGATTRRSLTGSSTSSSFFSTSRGGGCIDRINPISGTSDCQKNRALCNDATYYEVMTKECPKTCGRCGSFSTTSRPNQSCVDLTNPRTGRSDCSTFSHLCNDSNYQTMMRTQCPKTCGFCGGNTRSTFSSTTTSSSQRGCTDQINPITGTSDCPKNRGLCNNSAYANVMRTQCRKTCGFC